MEGRREDDRRGAENIVGKTNNKARIEFMEQFFGSVEKFCRTQSDLTGSRKLLTRLGGSDDAAVRADGGYAIAVACIDEEALVIVGFVEVVITSPVQICVFVGHWAN